MTGKYAYVMMIQEKWWRRFCRSNHEGKEIHSYVLRGLAPPTQTSLILFYVTKPISEIAGYAEFIERCSGDADEMWEKRGVESVLDSKEEFEDFVGDTTKVSFIRFRNLCEATYPVSLDNALRLLGKKRLSRKGFYVDKENADRLIASMG